MKQKYIFVLKKFKFTIPFIKLKISCGYTMYNTDNILNKGTLIDSLLAEGFKDGQQFELTVKEI